ncbi:radical SAM protein [Thermosipho atlanticus]|uniref:Biotin synthase n=1 Tax=Thermosipho atlanticus DSM 15807 TaxID=1123380 RepID=A0A1M5SEY4_9BACT|nr:radical SAM protein [Thermosipho atlanticus]SHH37157.1 biotin synthase [Thermosipho atlanticus DSM 15807]
MILRASYGTLGLLGLTKSKIRMDTAYFMLDGKCVFDCHFCSHARSSVAHNKFLSRIIWKEIRMEDLKKLSNAKRVCIQVVSYPGYKEDLIEVLRHLKNHKVSVSVRALTFDEVKMYFDIGVDSVGLAVDIVNRKLFKMIRGGNYDKVLELIEKSSSKFPGKITTHVIVGLGETDKELINFFYYTKKLNVNVALFAFTPIKGTKLEKFPPPSRGRYRRIQLARFLIFEKNIEPEKFIFDNQGMLKEIEVGYFEGVGKAFLTSGCSFCTRPYYNEKPGEEPFNQFVYSKKLEVEAKKILEG